MNVGHVMAVLDGVEADFVGGAVDNAALEAAAGHADSEAVDVMVAAVGSLGAARAQVVKPAHKVEGDALFVGAHVAVRPAVVEGVCQLGTHWYGVMRRAQVMTVASIPVFAAAHRHKLRQIFVERSQPVMDPSP